MMETVERLTEAKEWALESDDFDMAGWAWMQLSQKNGEVCGTTMCLAGYGAHRAEPTLWSEMMQREMESAKASGRITFRVDGFMDGRSISEVATKWFGITSCEAEELFHAGDINDDNFDGESWLDIINWLIEKYSVKEKS